MPTRAELGFLQAQQLKVRDDAAASLERALALAEQAPSPEVSIRATWKIRQLAGEVEVRRDNAQVAYGHFQKCLELSDGTIGPSSFGPLLRSTKSWPGLCAQGARMSAARRSRPPRSGSSS